MNRQTIDYGIDLGTTNSEIACVDPGSRPMVIENNYNERITPSAVAYSNKGQFQVGKTAYRYFNSHRWEDEDNVHIEFKRRMGTDDTFLFPYTGKKYRAEELSAEVLKELRVSVERKRGEQIDATVITIPAAFEQPQIAATKKAAELAGFATCELLQEPVAHHVPVTVVERLEIVYIHDHNRHVMTMPAGQGPGSFHLLLEVRPVVHTGQRIVDRHLPDAVDSRQHGGKQIGRVIHEGNIGLGERLGG